MISLNDIVQESKVPRIEPKGSKYLEAKGKEEKSARKTKKVSQEIVSSSLKRKGA